MLASLVLAASLLGQGTPTEKPPSGGIYQPSVPIVLPLADPILTYMGTVPRQYHVDNPYPFRVVPLPVGTPAGFYRMAATRPWYFVPPPGWGIR